MATSRRSLEPGSTVTSPAWPGAAHPGATAWLIGLAHLLYALSQRGSADPLTQRELDAFTRTPQCVAAMKAAAARWDALPAAA